MRVSDVDMIANNEEIFSLGLRLPKPTDKYLAKAIIGLGADELTPKFYGFGLQGNLKFYDFSLPAREVVMRIVLNPNYTLNERYSDLRDELYKAIAASRSADVQLILRAGATSVAQISGRIVKFEVPHFSKVPELQVTVKCDDPMFRGVTTTLLKQADLNSVGVTLPNGGRKITDAFSTAPHGCLFKFTFTAATPTFILQDKPASPNWQFRVDPSGGFLNGDILRISSEFLNRYVTIERASVIYTQANRVATGSLWPVIFPGANEFYTNITSGFTWSELSYKTSYWGV